MPDIIANAQGQAARQRDDAQTYQMQQQMDALRRDLRETAARLQWLEDLYKQNEGGLAKLQIGQDQFAQTITQALNARQMDEARVKQQVAELASRADEPMKLLRELRAQVTELGDSRRTDRERFAAEIRQYEGWQGQMRDLVAQIGLLADGQRQLRDLVQELDAVNNETRQEIVRINDLQRMEEQRLRRHGIELQETVESLRLQFQDTVSRAQRIDDVRRQVNERIEAAEALLSTLQQEDARQETILLRLDKQVIENHSAVQERAEGVRGAFEVELAEVRQVGDARMERYIGRFQQLEERIRDVDQRLSELPPRFDHLVARDQEIETEREILEELHLRKEIEGLEAQLADLRSRRAQKQLAQAPPAAPGLIRSVRDARPPPRPEE